MALFTYLTANNITWGFSDDIKYHRRTYSFRKGDYAFTYVIDLHTIEEVGDEQIMVELFKAVKHFNSAVDRRVLNA